MPNFSDLESQFVSQLRLERRPVAVAFLEEPPAGVEKFSGSVPSGCSFWRVAAEGKTFYTVPSDHYNCPVGSHTHNIPLPEERQPELGGVLNLMGEIGYLRMEEVPGIPVLPKSPNFVLYAPLGSTPVAPDAVLFSGTPGSLMLLVEAATRAGVFGQFPLLGRPTCMSIPAAMAHGVVASSGCIGNRVYTDIGENELYVTAPGSSLDQLAEALNTIASANEKLEEYHRGRRAQFATL